MKIANMDAVQVHAVVGVLSDDTDPMVTVMKLEKAPAETYADIGGLDTQIQEIKESVELPLTHPEYYEEMGIKPPKVKHTLFNLLSSSSFPGSYPIRSPRNW